MKSWRGWLMVLLILVLGMPLGCGKKVLRSSGLPAAPAQEISKGAEGQASAEDEKARAAAADKSAELERERRMREEALREKAAREEAARREALARDEAKKLKLTPVYFDYDQWSIREDQKPLMAQNADWLKSHPRTVVQIEGNCDDRGTAEYNLALGQKRAEAVKGYLEGLGIPANRMKTISYGLEHPLDPGHNEAAWAKNRRADFVVLK